MDDQQFISKWDSITPQQTKIARYNTFSTPQRKFNVFTPKNNTRKNTYQLRMSASFQRDKSNVKPTILNKTIESQSYFYINDDQTFSTLKYDPQLAKKLIQTNNTSTSLYSNYQNKQKKSKKQYKVGTLLTCYDHNLITQIKSVHEYFRKKKK